MRALEQIAALREAGSIDSARFASAKQRCLGRGPPDVDPRPVGPARRGRTLAVVFDGVLCDGSGAPVLGALAWLEQAVERFDVAVIVSELSGGEALASPWLHAHGLPSHALERIRFPAHKPPAMVYLDARAVRFEGSFPDVRLLLGYAVASQ